MGQHATTSGNPRAGRGRTYKIHGLALILLALSLALATSASAFASGGGGWVKQTPAASSGLFDASSPYATHGWVVGGTLKSASYVRWSATKTIYKAPGTPAGRLLVKVHPARGTSNGKRLAVKALPTAAVMKLGTVDWLKTSCYLPDAFNPDRSGNWAEPDYLACYTDGAGSIAVVTKRYTGDTLAIDTFNPRTLRRIGSRRSISLAGWPCWGGFYAGADGCFYVLVGRENPNENDDREVVAVRRYDRNWTLLGTAYIQGSSDLTGGGIYSPFVGGAPHMVLVGERLVVHMGRLIYAIDDLHHQVNLTFEVDVDTMTATTFEWLGDYANCSHSFQQLVAMNGSNLITIDHGDANPRAIQMGVMADYPGQREVQTYKLFEFNGAYGRNFTGATVTGLVSGPSGIVVVGNSIRQPDAPNGPLGSNTEQRNIYAIWADPATGAHTVRWLTHFAPQGAGNALEPRVVQVGADRYAILFSIQNRGGYRMEYRLIDSAGAVLASKSFPGVFFSAGSDPILIGGKVYWVGMEPHPRYLDVPQSVYLFRLDAKPFTPSPAKEITAFRFASPRVIGAINQTLRIIALTVPSGTDVTALVPTITITGASVSPRSVMAADFTRPVTYTVTAADGTAQSYTVTVTVATGPPTLAIGDAYGGGIVAYILRTGDPGYDASVQHGMIAATADQTPADGYSGAEWATDPYLRASVPGGTGSAIGAGAANTNAIVAQNGVGRTYAAGLARAYTGGGYADWFLPSKDELNQLYLSRDAIGGFHSASERSGDWPYYWCSSEFDAFSAWAQDFSDGSQFHDRLDKSHPGRVRAVRAF